VIKFKELNIYDGTHENISKNILFDEKFKIFGKIKKNNFEKS